MNSVKVFGSYTSDATRAAQIDARVKICLLCLVSAGVFTARSLGAVFMWFVLLGVAASMSGVPVRAVTRALKPMIVILAFTLLANLISCDGNPQAFAVGPVGVDVVGGIRGLKAVLRIVLLVGFALTVSASTTPTQVSDSIVRLLKPCARWGLPVAQLGAVLSLALRFIPLVGEELSRIQMAQRARGASFDGVGLLARIKAWVSIFIPLLTSLMRRADCIGTAMAARCYPEGADAPLPAPHPLSLHDWGVFAGGSIAAAVLILIGW